MVPLRGELKNMKRAPSRSPLCRGRRPRRPDGKTGNARYDVGAGALDSPAVFLKVLMRLWANTCKKCAYSPIIVFGAVLFRAGECSAVVGYGRGGRIAAPLLLWQNADVGHWLAMTGTGKDGGRFVNRNYVVTNVFRVFPGPPGASAPTYYPTRREAAPQLFIIHSSLFTTPGDHKGGAQRRSPLRRIPRLLRAKS